MPDQPMRPRDSDELVWSPDQMIARLGGDEELAGQLVTLFIGECPRMMAHVRESVEQGDGPAVTALVLETMGRDGRLDEAAATLSRLEHEVDVLLSQLRAFKAAFVRCVSGRAE
jgi:hypothetical protein